LDFNQQCPTDNWLIPFWWKKLFRDREFGAKVAARWSELRSGAYTTARINARIDSLNTMMDEAQARNFTAWKVLGKYVWPNRYVGNTFSQEVTYLKSWINERLTWMDANMPGLIMATPEVFDEAIVSAAPNPFESTLVLQYTLAAGSAVYVRILDAGGRPVHSVALTHSDAGTYHYRWDASHSTLGLYYFQVYAKDRLLGSGKLIHR
jgi:hypothetical protein